MGNFFSDALGGLGHLAEKAAPFVGMIPGVGTLAGGAIGGLGALAAGDGLGGAIRYGGEGALGAGLGGMLGKATSVASMLGGGGDSSIPATMPGMSYNPDTGAVTTDSSGGGSSGGGIASGIEGLLGKAGSFLTGNNGMNALGVAQGVNQALQQKTATNYAKDALGTTTASYNERAPLRAEALSQLANPTIPSLAGVNRTMTTGSPYAQAPSPAPPSPAPSTAPLMPSSMHGLMQMIGSATPAPPSGVNGSIGAFLGSGGNTAKLGIPGITGMATPTPSAPTPGMLGATRMLT